jgi:putative transposase
MFVPDFARWPEFRSRLAAFTELLSEGIRFLRTIARSRTALAAEVLFLGKQLTYYQEREIRPRRLTDGARLSLVFWSRFFDWNESLAIVTAETFIRWHRKGFQFDWRWKSRGGRPALPKEIRQLIARMVKENITWGEERIADELSLKLGIYVSPRTVRKYWPKDSGDRGRRRTSSQHWKTFVKNHAAGIVACDFLVAADDLAKEHHWVPNSGWITFQMGSEEDLRHAPLADVAVIPPLRAEDLK